MPRPSLTRAPQGPARQRAPGGSLLSLSRAVAHVRRHGRDERGQAILELALVASVLLVLLLATIDLGRIYYAQVTVANAARAGAMEYTTNDNATYQAGNPCNGTTNTVMCAVTNEASNSTVVVVPADVSVSCSPSCAKAFGNRVTVTVTGHFTVLTPLIWVFTGGSTVTFTQVADADMVYDTPPTVLIPTASATAGPTASSAAPSASASAAPSSSVAPTASASASPTVSPTPACFLPVANFTHSQQNRNQPVQFTSTGTLTTGVCAITYWRWEYGDTTSDAGNFPTASHDYGRTNQGRTFQVTLSVTNPAGIVSITRSVTTRSQGDD